MGFLRLVLPAEGEYIVAVKARVKENGRTSFHHYPFSSLEELSSFTLEQDARGQEVYLATASYVKQAGDKHGRVRRTKDLVRAKRSLYIDLDVQKSGDAKSNVYATRDVALAEVPRIIALLGGVEPTIIVYSGNGVHLYWAFDRDASAAEWKVMADAFKQHLADAGIHFDHNVTTDVTRVLRAPGTHNRKPETPEAQRLVMASAVATS